MPRTYPGRCRPWPKWQPIVGTDALPYLRPSKRNRLYGNSRPGRLVGLLPHQALVVIEGIDVDWVPSALARGQRGDAFGVTSNQRPAANVTLEVFQLPPERALEDDRRGEQAGVGGRRRRAGGPGFG